MIPLSIGLALDFIIGDPQNPYHPVRFIGRLGVKAENFFRKKFSENLKFGGLLTWITVVLVTFAVTASITKIGYRIRFYYGFLFEGILIYFCISAKGLIVEGLKVINILKSGDIEGARKQLSYIVGRDTAALDEKGVVRAVIETVAENISDGIIGPMFFAAIGGAPAAMVYKAVNTCDSMFGYKNEKYIDFGFYSAKIDDIFNFIPARITGYLIVVASWLLSFDYEESYKIYKRDRYNHTSPNSAHPEAAVAGALGIKLGGPNYYFGKLVNKPTIGDNRKEIDISDLYKTNSILIAVTFLAYFLFVVSKMVL